MEVIGKQNSGYFGFGVKMNKAGDRFVASAPLDDQVLSPNGGTMRVYQYSPSGSSSGLKLVLTWEDIQLMITMGQLPLTGLEIEWHF